MLLPNNTLANICGAVIMKRQNKNRPELLFQDGCCKKVLHLALVCYGCPMEHGRPIYFHPVVSSIFYLFFLA